MKDARYIRISGRPLFLIYRSDVIPETAKAIARWRRRFKTEHNLDPLILMAQSFGVFDPRPEGFDGAYEFPPHKFGGYLPRVTHDLKLLDYEFRGQVCRYDDLVKASLADFPDEYDLIKTVVPSWDNDARKQGSGLCFHGSTPSKFEAWVKDINNSPRASMFHGERLLFVNAWNEWCEGAYLEPDVHYGFAYLNALSRALDQSESRGRQKVLLVGHDAFPAGAQMLLYNIGRTLITHFGVEVSFILMGGGDMIEQYRSLASTFVVDNTDSWDSLNVEIKRLHSAGYEDAITNSIFSGHIVELLLESGLRVCSLIHELSTIVERNHGVDRYNAIARCSRHVVFPNSYVKAQIEEAFGVADGAVHVIPQGLYSKTSIDATDVSGRIKQKLGIPEESFIVVNTGYADLRKGVDLFVDLSQRVSSLDSRIHFVWLGNIDPVVDAWIVNDVRRGRFRNLHFVGFVDDVTSVLNSADLFFLSSREDPFPSAVLEATSVGLPVASFDTGGGYVDFIKGNPLVGFLVPSDDLDASAQIICNAIYSDEINDARSISYRRALIETDYDFRSYCFNIVNLLKTNLKISVIVPNYNYRSYLRDRLQSIFEQTYPVFEIIVLDDCSTDGSLQELDSISLDVNRDFRIVANDVNSGNVFAQWRRGINACKGDFVWIAEADDLADPTFLERLIPLVSADNVGMAFTDSRTVDEGGLLQWNTYKSYYSTLFPGALSESAIFDGATFFRDYLSVKNVIMNVSSVLWRKSALDRALDGCGADLRKFQMAGDWRVYAEICSLGHRVGYEAQPLNVHRRHSNSVTHSLKRELHRDEIAIMHDLARRRLGRAAPRDVQRAYLDEIVAQFGIAD